MRFLILASFLVIGFAGCADTDPAPTDPSPAIADPVPFLDYTPIEPDLDLPLLMEDLFAEGSTGNTLHARITRPDTDEPVPVIVQHTPYTAPGCNTAFYNGPAEPPVGGCSEGTFEHQFARRGYAYVHADLRGTGDSDDCLDLRGPTDIADIGALADALAAQPWSNGNVGFIGASYPGSTSHMAALSGSAAVKAVVPIVASTSFYHYHHNDGVPYFANHLATNAGYTQQGVTPTFNPLSAIQKLADQPLCPHVENAVLHGAADQSGSYYEWWQDRNLRPLAGTVQVPVLMAQGLADWNVKPDHIAHWYNDLPGADAGAPKTLIAGQWGHAYPQEAEDAYGPWWPYVTAFFDTYLKEIDTGMFQTDVAWVQANDGSWHRSSDWPLTAAQRDAVAFHIHPDGRLAAEPAQGDATASWYGCSDTALLGQNVEAPAAVMCAIDEPTEELVFETAPFAADTLLSGVGFVNLTLRSEVDFTHLIAVIDHLDGSGNVVVGKENYGYLNPTYRHGIDAPEAVPVGETYRVSIDLYPQEDLIQEGHKLRLTLRSNDSGAIASYASGWNHLIWEDGAENTLWLPTRPADLQGTRLG